MTLTLLGTVRRTRIDPLFMRRGVAGGRVERSGGRV
jgi:hypothetical protein